MLRNPQLQRVRDGPRGPPPWSKRSATRQPQRRADWAAEPERVYRAEGRVVAVSCGYDVAAARQGSERHTSKEHERVVITAEITALATHMADIVVTIPLAGEPLTPPH
jgi:hypothetical protein